MTTTRMSREASGELVRHAIMQVRPAGLSKDQLADETHLSHNQVTNGITWIRETAAAEHLTPLTYSRAAGYRFSQDPDDWIAFEQAQLLRLLTSIKRTLSGVADPHAALMPEDAVARWIKGQFNLLQSTIEATLNPPPVRTPA